MQATAALPPSHARALAVLPESLQQHLRARGAYAPARLLESPLLDLVEALDLPLETIKQIRATVGQRLSPPSSTVAELAAAAASATAPRHVPTGLDALDGALHGGIPAGSVTEVVGPAGMGKTQMCMTVTVNSLLGGAIGGRSSASTVVAAAEGSDAAGPLSGQRQGQPLQSDGGGWQQEEAAREQQGSVVYIDAEGKMSIKRLEEIARARFPDSPCLARVLDRVIVYRPGSSGELLGTLKGLDAVMLPHAVRLVVMDSVAALARLDFAPGVVQDRQRALGQQASALKRLAETYSVPVLVTNQVMARVREAPTESSPTGGGGGGNVAAALGTMWAHAVNTRLVLEAHSGTRFIRVVKSPSAPNIAFAFEIGMGGPRVLPGVVPPPQLQASVVDMPIANELALERGPTA